MGGSSSQVTGYRYFAKFALFIGNTIEGIHAINIDKRGWVRKLFNDHRFIFTMVDQNLFGETEGGYVGTIDIRFGLDDQAVNEDWKKEVPLISSYPYQSYLVFRGIREHGGWVADVANEVGATESFYLGNSGYMKEMLLWPKRIHVRNDGRGQWYDEKADVPSQTIIGSKNEYVDDNGQIIPALNFYVEDLESGFIRSNTANYFPFSDGVGSNIAQGIVSDFEQNIKFRISGADLNSFPGYKVSILLSYHVRDFYVEIPVGSIVEDLKIRDVTSNYPNTTGENWRYMLVEYALEPSKGVIGVDIFAKGGVKRPSDAEGDGKFEYYVNATVSRAKVISSPVYADSGDINPIHKIREILTDDTAMNKPESFVNDVNFIKAADRIYNEGLGISWSITEKSCMDAINELCYHIEAGIRVNRQTGLYEMVLFRDDWFEENEIHVIAENKIKKGSMQYEITNADEVVNQVNVNYYDRANIKNSSFSISESGLIQTLGRVNAETVDFPYFMNMRNAEIVANWKLKILSTGVLKGSFTTGWREARKWNRYDLLRLPWSKRWAGTILVRIMNIKLGGPTSNEVSIEWVEVVPMSGMMNTTIVADEPVNTQPEAPKPCNAKVFELPYFEAVQSFGEREVGMELADNPGVGYLCAIAEKPQNNSLNAALHADSGSGFERVAAVNYCETAYLDQAIDRISSSFVVKNVGNIVSVRVGSQIFINDEIMVYQSYDTETKVLTVKRGAFGVPQNHAVNSILYFADDFIAVDQTLYVQSEIVNAKVLTTTPSGVLAFDDAATHEVEFNAKAIRPYPPANVKINGEYWPAEIETDLILTWVDRNRLQQTGGEILGWFDGGVTIEPNTQTHLVLSQLDGNNVELATSNANVTGATSYTMPISSTQADTRFVKIILKTIRDGYESYQSFDHTVELSQFFSAPYDLTVEFKETNRLELNWKLDGFVDEQRYYYSVSPIDINNLPTPKSVLAGDVRTYIDTDIEASNSYYVRIGSIKNSIEKISDQIKVSLSTNKYEIIIFGGDVKNIGTTTGITWVKNAATLVPQKEIQFSENGYVYSNQNFDWSSAWEMKFDLFIENTSTTKQIFSNRRDVWNSGGFLLQYEGDASANAGKISFNLYGAALQTTSVVSKGVWLSIRITKNGSTIYNLYIDNVIEFNGRNISSGLGNVSAGVISLGGRDSVNNGGIRIRNFILN